MIAGIIGCFYDADFATGSRLGSGDAFGLLAVDGWHNLLHIATGLLGLISGRYAARAYAFALGLAYVVVAIWGFTATTAGVGALADLIAVNTAGNIVHLIVGLTGLGAAAASRRSDPARVSPRSR